MKKRSGSFLLLGTAIGFIAGLFFNYSTYIHYFLQFTYLIGG